MQDIDCPSQQESSLNRLQLMCRLCANTSDYLIPIFKGEGIDYQLQLKISQYIHVEVKIVCTP